VVHPGHTPGTSGITQHNPTAPPEHTPGKPQYWHSTPCGGARGSHPRPATPGRKWDADTLRPLGQDSLAPWGAHSDSYGVEKERKRDSNGRVKEGEQGGRAGGGLWGLWGQACVSTVALGVTGSENWREGAEARGGCG